MEAAQHHPVEWTAAEEAALGAILELAIAEDIGSGDLTTEAIVPPEAQATAHIAARQAGMVAGLTAAGRAWQRVDDTVRFVPAVHEGTFVPPGARLATVHGPARALLTGERLALNLIGRLSGVATLTHRYVDQIKGTEAVILDTRKTTPGWRVLEKYAVRAGGGANHRLGLFDAVLIKDNHLAFAASTEGGELDLAGAVRKARAAVPAGTIVEVEVDTLEQFAAVLAAEPDIVLLDNMSPEQLQEAVARRNAEAPQVLLEASGGVNLETVAEIARTGVDRISAGALTHSAVALDVGLDWDD